MIKRSAFAAMLALAFGACTDDTGILVEVHGEQLTAAVARLDTLVIVDDGSGTQPTSADWGSAAAKKTSVSGIDLRTTPYTVMLRPAGVGDRAKVWFSAVAYDASDTVIGYGEMPEVSFGPNLVKQVELDLTPAATVAGGKCVVVGGAVVVRTSNDCDGDGVPFTTDCNDLDPAVGGDFDGDPVVCGGDCNTMNANVYPGAPEICDGLDDDCDPTTQPPPQLCAQVTRTDTGVVTDCRVGEQICNDTHPGGVLGACVDAPIDPTTYQGLCSLWADCLATSNAPNCLVDGRIRCLLGVKDTTPCLPATYPLISLLPNTTDCTWELIGNIQQGAWNVGLVPTADPTAPLSTFSDVCDAQLVVEASDGLPRVFVLENVANGVITDYSLLIDPRRADCDPQNGSMMDCQVVP